MTMEWVDSESRWTYLDLFSNGGEQREFESFEREAQWDGDGESIS